MGGSVVSFCFFSWDVAISFARSRGCRRGPFVRLQRLRSWGRVVYCVVTDPAPSQRHDKIGMMTARHRVGPCRYRDGGGKWGNFRVARGRPRWISHGHVR